MKNLIIVGAGGMGRSFFDIAINCIGYMVEFRIKGFLDDNIHQLDTFENYPYSFFLTILTKNANVFINYNLIAGFPYTVVPSLTLLITKLPAPTQAPFSTTTL